MSAIKTISQNQNLFGAEKTDSAQLKKDERDPKMLEAARSFENQFIRQMISEMRKTVPKDELVGEGMADDIYRSQLDDQYADMWVDQGGVGLADKIYEQLYEKFGNHVNPLPVEKGAMIPMSESGKAIRAGLANSANTARESGGKSQVSSHMSQVSGDMSLATGNKKFETRPRDLFTHMDKQLFMLKRAPDGGVAIKSKEPLPEAVGLRSPLSGVVLQSAAIGDGREMVVVRHDQGLVSQFVHTGHNRVKTHTRVDAGEVIAELPASRAGEFARVFYGLRKAAKSE